MTELFNFHGTFFVAAQHWVWLAVALGLGIWTGWHTGAEPKE